MSDEPDIPIPKALLDQVCDHLRALEYLLLNLDVRRRVAAGRGEIERRIEAANPAWKGPEVKWPAQ